MLVEIYNQNSIKKSIPFRDIEPFSIILILPLKVQIFYIKVVP